MGLIIAASLTAGMIGGIASNGGLNRFIKSQCDAFEHSQENEQKIEVLDSEHRFRAQTAKAYLDRAEKETEQTDAELKKIRTDLTQKQLDQKISLIRNEWTKEQVISLMGEPSNRFDADEVSDTSEWNYVSKDGSDYQWVEFDPNGRVYRR